MVLKERVSARQMTPVSGFWKHLDKRSRMDAGFFRDSNYGKPGNLLPAPASTSRSRFPAISPRNSWEQAATVKSGRRHAPGGLFKAVKFIYGDANSKRARSRAALVESHQGSAAPLSAVDRTDRADRWQRGHRDRVRRPESQTTVQKQRAKGLAGLPREELLGLPARRRRRLGLHLRQLLVAASGHQAREPACWSEIGRKWPTSA